MSNQEILTKSIEKAIAGGWEPVVFADKRYKLPPRVWHVETEPIDDSGIYVGFEFGTTGNILRSWEKIADNIEQLIYNHDFAKALWGDIKTEAYGSGHEGIYPSEVDFRSNWQFHLQQMVIAPDAIQYLGANI